MAVGLAECDRGMIGLMVDKDRNISSYPYLSHYHGWGTLPESSWVYTKPVKLLIPHQLM